MVHDKEVVAGLDIGTGKTCCVIALVDNMDIEVIGVGTHPSTGLRKGIIINIEATVESIKRALKEAETMSGSEINSVYVNVAGSHLMDMNSHGVIAVNSKEVALNDVTRVIDAAQAVNIPMDREILHVLPQEFIVDGQDGILKPIGMNGVRLESKVHIITAALSATQNITRSVTKANLSVERIVVDQLASSEAVLDSDEKELGVALVDIGAGACDIAIYTNNAIRATKSVSLGGYNITHDISIGLRTPFLEAEKIKIIYGSASSSLIGSDDMISVPGVGGRSPSELSRRVLTDIIEPRVVEILELVKKEIELSGFYQHIASGVVLTGGTALMPGIANVAEEILELPSRVGFPRGVAGLSDLITSPVYSSAVGLVRYAAIDIRSSKRKSSIGKKSFSSFISKAKSWIEDFF